MHDPSINRDRLRRVVVIGTSCSGKTTFASRLSRILGTKHIEMDTLNWLPEWEERGTPELRELTRQEISSQEWVLDGNYSRVRDLTWKRATLIVWLNYSFPVVLYRAIKRTTRRAFLREELFNGNRESIRTSFFSTDSMILWVFKTHNKRKRVYSQQVKENGHGQLEFLVLNSSNKAEEFLNRVERSVTKG